MARELILKLSDDVGQLLVAGAHLAPSSSELAQDRDGLAKLAQQVGAKAPAIVKLAEAADKTTKAGAGAVASELMNLMQMAAQVRAAQTQAAPLAGEAQPLEACPAIGTPCNAKDLDDLYAALVEKGQGRLEVIERHIEGETIADLRLVEALVFAMGDSWIGETITDKAIPKLGRAIVAPIRARLDLKKGRSVDGRRLRALVAIEKEGAKELLEKAVAEGSVELREAAMDAIADHVQGQPEFEKHALEAIRKEKSADIRRAAVRALAGSSSDEALEVLLEAIGKPNTRAAASQALARSKHPKAAQQLLAKLQETIAAPKPKAKKGASDKDKEKTKSEAEFQKQVASALLEALAEHQLPAIASAALELMDEYGATAAWAAINSADRAQLAKIADAINGDDSDLYQPAAEAAFRLGPDEAFKRLSPLFKAKDRDKKPGGMRLAAILYIMRSERRVTQTWLDFFLGLIEKDSPAIAQLVIQPMGEAKDKRALKPLIKIVNEGRGDIVNTAIAALGEIGDPSALDCMLERLSSKDTRGWTVRNAVLSLNDPSSVDKVRTIYAKLKDPNHYNNWAIRSLLHSLEARFPGR
jgi:HEAT repeat protein